MRVAHRYTYLLVADFDEFLRGVNIDENLYNLVKRLDRPGPDGPLGNFLFPVRQTQLQHNKTGLHGILAESAILRSGVHKIKCIAYLGENPNSFFSSLVLSS